MSTIVLALASPPMPINANGLELPSPSTKHLEMPYFASDVFPIPGGPSNPILYPFLIPRYPLSNNSLYMSFCRIVSIYTFI